MRIELNKVQKILEWVRRKIYLETIVGNAGKRMVKRGQVYRCDFGVGIGSEMQKDRPAIIVQNDIGNIHSSNTIVIPITHTQHDSPCVVTIAPKKMVDGEVILDGCANASNIMCISKARLGNYIATLSQSEMKQVDEAVAKSMGMMHYYADLKKKYDDKLKYIAKIKAERNMAQDEINLIREMFGVNDNERVSKHLEKYIDKELRME